MTQDAQGNTRIRPNDTLKRERQRRGWSREYVAECIGVADPKTIGRWERGVAFPSTYFLQKLCGLFEQMPHELGLFHEEGWLPAACSPLAQPLPLSQQESVANPAAPIFDPAIPLPRSEADGLVARDDIVQQLKQRLSSGKGHTLTALYGLPGVGKTAIAVALAYDEDIQQRFRDGILWATPGSDARTLAHLTRWAGLLGLKEAEMACLTSPEEWALAIRRAIGTRRLLIVIDDAWTSEDAYAVSIGGPNCSYLLTTRLPAVALHFANHNALHLHEWNEDDGLQLLARFIPTIVAQNVEVARTLVRATGGLPLGITLIGKYCQAHAYSGQQRRLRVALERLHSVEERLRLSTFRTVLNHGESEARQSLISLEGEITASFVRLDEPAQFTLCQLSVFPAKPNSFSEEAALTVCGTSVEALDALVDAGLLEAIGPGRYTLHRTIADYGSLRRNLHMTRKRMVTYFAYYLDRYHMDTYALELEQQNIKAALHIAFDQNIAASTLVGGTGFVSFLQAYGCSEEAAWYLQRTERAIRHSRLNIDWSYVIAHQEQHTQLLQERTATRLKQVSKCKEQFSLPTVPQGRLYRLLTGPPLSS